MPLFTLFVFTLFIICLFTIISFTIPLIYLFIIYLFSFPLFSFYLFTIKSFTITILILLFSFDANDTVLPLITSYALHICVWLEVVEILSTTSLRISSMCLFTFFLDMGVDVVAAFLGDMPLAVNLNKAFLHQIKFNIALDCRATQACLGTQFLQRCLTVLAENG